MLHTPAIFIARIRAEPRDRDFDHVPNLRSTRACTLRRVAPGTHRFDRIRGPRRDALADVSMKKRTPVSILRATRAATVGSVGSDSESATA